MRSNSRFWYLISILCFLAAIWFWLKGNEEAARRNAGRVPGGERRSGDVRNTVFPSPASGTVTGQSPTAVSPAGAAQTTGGAAPPPRLSPAGPQGRFPYRL